MSAVLLGTVAALVWGLHDFLARFVSRSLGSLQAVLIVLAVGAAFVFATMQAAGEPVHIAPGRAWLILLAGVAYALALKLLYDAFAIGPVSLVAPIIGAYPVFAMIWAVVNGAQPTVTDWLAVAAIMAGVALVARFAEEAPADPTEAPIGSRAKAILCAGLSCAGFAISIIAGQSAASNSSELSVTLFARLAAIGIIAPICLQQRVSFSGARSWLPVLVLMGALDAGGLAAVVAAGKMDAAELATVVGSCFGAVTVVLAVVFLKERLSLPQLLGMVMILGGVLALSSRY